MNFKLALVGKYIINSWGIVDCYDEPTDYAGAFIDVFAGHGLGVDHCWSPDYSYQEAPKVTSITFSKGLGFGVGYDQYSNPLPILNWGGN